MKAVGIKELKAHLSDYVRQARAGETVLVTDRNQVVAELIPPRQSSVTLKSEDYRQEHVLANLAASGQVTRAEVANSAGCWQVKGLGLPAGSAAQLLQELRRDRDEDE